MRLLYVSALACTLATAGKADLLYSFSYNAATGPLHSFAFSFTAPDFVVNGDSPAFTTFTLTDGTTSWTMVSDLIEVGGTGVGCFAFGTATAQLTTIFGPCSFAVGGAGVGAFIFVTSGGLPSAVGTYPSSDFTGIFNTAGGSIKSMGPVGGSTDDAGSMSLTISTSVPEPSTITLLALCFLAFSKWFLSKNAWKSSSPLRLMAVTSVTCEYSALLAAVLTRSSAIPSTEGSKSARPQPKPAKDDRAKEENIGKQ